VSNFITVLSGQLKKEKLLSASNILVMAVTFVLLGLFINIIVYTQTTLKYLEQQAQITIFFKDTTTQDQILTYKKNLEQDGRVMEVAYISKEDALKIFKDMNKDEPVLLESVSASILPASLEVKAKNIANLKTMTEDYKKLEGVEEVKYFEDVVSKFSKWSTIIYIISFVLVAIFLCVSYSVIIATLRTVINSRGQELEVMKLVGASDDYVKRPFIYQGIFYGFTASALSAVINIILNIVLDRFSIFSKGLAFGFIPGLFVHPVIFSAILCVILITFGTLLGYFGSLTAIKKYLNY
jgi:cell division transport system permease protein